MPFVNQGAWIPSKGARIEVRHSKTVDPGEGEVLIQNHAWGINPIDGKMQSLGIQLDSYPTMFGCDVAGEVVAVGENVTTLKVGGRVLAHPLGLQSKRECELAFQLYSIVEARWAVPIPADMPYEEAAKLPLGILTATTGLYTSQHRALPLPTLKPTPQDGTLLIWGGSSNVGAAANQLATASGFAVVSTASVANHEMVRKLGVVEMFDHRSPSVVLDLVEHLRRKTVLGAFDAIGTAQTTKTIAEILSQLGGGRITSTLPNVNDLPPTVTGKQIFAPASFLHEPAIGEAVWHNFLPQALQNGQIRSVLKTCIAGRGLESIQTGIDEVSNGVSATKVVVVA